MEFGVDGGGDVGVELMEGAVQKRHESFLGSQGREGVPWAESGGAVTRAVAVGGSRVAQPVMKAAYSSAESSSPGSPLIFTLNSQPPSNGAEFTSEGSLTTSSLISVISPSTGE